ncbi:hypothetical protein FRC04_008355, partial [Tulasnella sp. 424]
MSSQRPTFPILPPHRSRPRIILRKLNISILRWVALELVRELWRVGLGYGPDAGVRISYRRGQIRRQHHERVRQEFEHHHSFLASVALFNFGITVPFVVGSSIVLGATWFYNQPAAEKPREVVDEKPGEDERSSLSVSLSSSSLKGSGRKPPTSPDHPSTRTNPSSGGDMNPKKRSHLLTPRSIASAVKGFISRLSSPSSNGQGAYFPVATGAVNGTPLNRTGSQVSLYTSRPLSRNQSNAGLAVTGMQDRMDTGAG